MIENRSGIWIPVLEIDRPFYFQLRHIDHALFSGVYVQPAVE